MATRSRWLFCFVCLSFLFVCFLLSPDQRGEWQGRGCSSGMCAMCCCCCRMRATRAAHCDSTTVLPFSAAVCHRAVGFRRSRSRAALSNGGATSRQCASFARRQCEQLRRHGLLCLRRLVRPFGADEPDGRGGCRGSRRCRRRRRSTVAGSVRIPCRTSAHGGRIHAISFPHRILAEQQSGQRRSAVARSCARRGSWQRSRSWRCAAISLAAA